MEESTEGPPWVPGPGGPDVIAWLRPLVRQLRTEPAHLSSGDTILLLEFEVDGARCLLIERRSPAPEHRLSPREREIALMVARGYADKMIAAELGISRWTVSTHLRRVYVKLAVHSRAAMVAKLAEDRLAWPELVPFEVGDADRVSANGSVRVSTAIGNVGAACVPIHVS